LKWQSKQKFDRKGADERSLAGQFPPLAGLAERSLERLVQSVSGPRLNARLWAIEVAMPSAEVAVLLFAFGSSEASTFAVRRYVRVAIH
jgi:hypothetical protein